MRPGMELDLVGVRQGKTGGLDLLKVLFAIVANTNASGLAKALDLQEPAPLVQPLGAAMRSMYQIEIDVVEAKSFQTAVEGGNGLFFVLQFLTPGRVALPEFGGHENVFAGESCLGDLSTDA